MNSTLATHLIFSDFLALILAILVTFCQYIVGFVLLNGIRSLGAKYRFAYRDSLLEAKTAVPLAWIFGLAVHLALALLAKCLWLPWGVILALPFAIILAFLFLWRDVVFRALNVFSLSLSATVHPTYLIWLLFHIVIGSSLFFVSGDINTPWVNNYGDLTFHLGMIHHFTFVGDFPPQYHLYAGEKLSYPFFINFWSALLWWPSSHLVSLPWIFLWQWLLLWSVIFVFLNGKKTPIIPWVAVLGGGSYFAIISFPDSFSWSMINEGFPFTSWLSTIWVTQRSAMLGAAISLACVWLVLNAEQDRESTKRSADSGNADLNLIVAGLLLGLMPLAHTHFFIFTALFVGLYIGLPAVWQTVLAFKQNKTSASEQKWWASSPWVQLYCVVAPALIAVVFFPLLMGKSGMVSLIPGWSIPMPQTIAEGLSQSATMWLKNAWHWFFVVGIVWVFISRKIALSVLALLFVLGNFVKLAVWDWDQLKVFLAIFLLFLVVWSQSSLSIFKSQRLNVLASIMLGVLLCVPGLYELSKVVEGQMERASPNEFISSYQVYDPAKIRMAEFIRAHTPQDAIIVSSSDHNAAATIAGRTMYMGYPGTLASHKINYQQRERVAKQLSLIASCRNYLKQDAIHCPDYVVWDRAAQNLWRNQNIPASFERITDSAYPGFVLYKVNSEN